MTFVLAADIGGTKLATGLVDPEGRLLASCSAPTPRGRNGEALYRALEQLLRQALSQAGLDRSAVVGVGVGCGGPMRLPEGLVSPLNIPAWRDFPLRQRLQSDFGVPARIDNDAKAFALGEYWIGAGRDASCLLAMVVSTGVGGGVVQSGRLIDGARGNAGHVGHVIVSPAGPRCPCGARGCVEALASGSSLAREARLAIANGVRTSIPLDATSREIAAAAAAGDLLAGRLFRRAGVALGRGIASAAALLDLDRVVIGGGVAHAAEHFMPSLQRELAARAKLDFALNLPVQVTTKTVDSALAGAARLVFGQ